jgi:hypothetical protein
MQHLEHLDLAPNLYARRGDDRNIAKERFSWKLAIPKALLPRLKTFALRNVGIYFSDALELIQSITTAQHITLDNVLIGTDSGQPGSTTYHGFFDKLWMHYDRAMDVTRPAFTVIQPIGTGTKSRMVCEELCEYLHYGEYEVGNPFMEDTILRPDINRHGGMKDGAGWVMDDRDERFMVRAIDYERVMGRLWLEDERDRMVDE